MVPRDPTQSGGAPGALLRSFEMDTGVVRRDQTAVAPFDHSEGLLVGAAAMTYHVTIAFRSSRWGSDNPFTSGWAAYFRVELREMVGPVVSVKRMYGAEFKWGKR